MTHSKKLINKFSGILIITIYLSISTVKSQTSLTKALDYDGDGKVDSVVYRATENKWHINKSSGGYTVFQAGTFPLDTPTPGDYDGDGKGDIAFWRESNGTFNYFRSSNNTFFSQQFGLTGDEPVARDYDGDGKTDLAVVRRIDGALIWYVLKSSNNSFSAIQYGIASDIPTPGDYDGDGKFDYAVQRFSSETARAYFYIFKSSEGSYTAEFGFGIDKVVPGDYDGDGKTDIAIVRDLHTGESDKLEWWIINSSNGSVIQINYGDLDLGDIPVPGDYNGDGKTDIAIWRSRTEQSEQSQFYIYGIGQYPFGLSGDLPLATYDTH
jgi:hypothetical protein